MRAALAGSLALCAARADAGVLSVSTTQAGGVLTLTISDTAPADMCADGLCAADFAIGFDPAVLEFIDTATASDFFVAANAADSGEVLLSLFADPDAFPPSNVLFSIGFRALASQQVGLTIAPRDFGVPGVYLPLAVEVTVDVAVPGAAVPEPNSALLAALGLAGLAWRRRALPAQRQRRAPSA